MSGARRVIAFIAPIVAFGGGVCVGYLLGADPHDLTVRSLLVSTFIAGMFAIFACWPEPRP